MTVESYAGAATHDSLCSQHGKYVAASALHAMDTGWAFCVVMTFHWIGYERGSTLRLVFSEIERYGNSFPNKVSPVFPWR